jgi:hypothetical protein
VIYSGPVMMYKVVVDGGKDAIHQTNFLEEIEPDTLEILSLVLLVLHIFLGRFDELDFFRFCHFVDQ